MFPAWPRVSVLHEQQQDSAEAAGSSRSSLEGEREPDEVAEAGSQQPEFRVVES